MPNKHHRHGEKVVSMEALKTRFLRSPTLSTIPIPTPAPNELLIKVSYASLNPTDYKHAAVALPPSKVIGCDFSGIVVSKGSNVAQNAFSEGDRIAGIVHGCEFTHTGAFAEYLVATADLCFHVPDNVRLEEACTLGVGWVSAMQALHQRLYNLDKDGDDDDGALASKEDTLLIYSAATNVGMHAIQQSRLDHPNTYIIALASLRHTEMLQKLGADVVLDYSSPDIIDQVRKLGRKIYHAIDCYSEGLSTVTTANCMLPSDHSSEGYSQNIKSRHRIIRTLPPSMIKGTLPSGVRADEWIVTYTCTGKPFWFLFKHYAASVEDYRAASQYLNRLTSLLAEGTIVPVRHRLMPGGLKDINTGFQELKNGKVRGEKLVYCIGGEAR